MVGQKGVLQLRKRRWLWAATAALVGVLAVGALIIAHADYSSRPAQTKRVATQRAVLPAKAAMSENPASQLGDDAKAAIDNPGNKNKWIGMAMGSDGKLHVAKIVDQPDQAKP